MTPFKTHTLVLIGILCLFSCAKSSENNVKSAVYDADGGILADLGIYINMDSTTKTGELLPTAYSWADHATGFSGDKLIGRTQDSYDIKKAVENGLNGFVLKIKVLDSQKINQAPSYVALKSGFWGSVTTECGDSEATAAADSSSVDILGEDSDGQQTLVKFCLGQEAGKTIFYTKIGLVNEGVAVSVIDVLITWKMGEGYGNSQELIVNRKLENLIPNEAVDYDLSAYQTQDPGSIPLARHEKVVVGPVVTNESVASPEGNSIAGELTNAGFEVATESNDNSTVAPITPSEELPPPAPPVVAEKVIKLENLSLDYFLEGKKDYMSCYIEKATLKQKDGQTSELSWNKDSLIASWRENRSYQMETIIVKNLDFNDKCYPSYYTKKAGELSMASKTARFHFPMPWSEKVYHTVNLSFVGFYQDYNFTTQQHTDLKDKEIMFIKLTSEQTIEQLTQEFMEKKGAYTPRDPFTKIGWGDYMFFLLVQEATGAKRMVMIHDSQDTEYFISDPISASF